MEYCKAKTRGSPPYYIPGRCSNRATKGEFCATHDPEAVQRRREASSAKALEARNARMDKFRRETVRPQEYRTALREIEGGAEGAQKIAREILEKWGDL
jgi:hypothetical protein